MLHASSPALRRLHAAAFVATCLATCVLNAASRLTNVSVRSTAGTGPDALIVGFSITGTGNKQVLVRGIGPGLTSFGVPNAAPDPSLRLTTQSNVQLAASDDWSGATTLSDTFASVGAFSLPAGSRDAALVTALPAGNYSAHVDAKGSNGVVLVEAYDADAATAPAQFNNVSARSLTSTGAAVLSVGFSITGDTRKTVLIRAVGPTLAGFGVPGVLANPQLKLFASGSVPLCENDDWLTAADWTSAFSAAGAFTLAPGTRDAALVVNLAPGTYSAQASGIGTASGVAMIEVYDLSNPPVTSFVIQPVVNSPPAGWPSSLPSPATFPSVISQARPQYPFELRRAGLSGEALIEFIVGPDGRVSGAYAIRAADTRFADAAVAAVVQWTFNPGRNASGQVVSTRMQVPIVFTLN